MLIAALVAAGVFVVILALLRARRLETARMLPAALGAALVTFFFVTMVGGGPKKERPVVVLDVNRVHSPIRPLTDDIVMTEDSSPREFVTLGNQVYFTALWGDEGGESPVDNHRIFRYFHSGGGDYVAEEVGGWSSETHLPEHLTAHGTHLYFAATTTAGSSRLWRLNSGTGAFSELTPAGTDQIARVYGIVSDGSSVHVLATHSTTGKLALWAPVIGPTNYDLTAETTVTPGVGEQVDFLECAFSGGSGFLMCGSGTEIGDYDLCIFKISWTHSGFFQVVDAAAVGNRLYFAGAATDGGTQALHRHDGSSGSVVAGITGAPELLFSGGDALFLEGREDVSTVHPYMVKDASVTLIDTGGTTLIDIFGFTRTPAGNIWFAAEEAGGVGLWEVNALGNAAEKRADLEGVTKTTDVASTDTRIVALTPTSAYFWHYSEDDGPIESEPFNLKSGAAPEGPMHTWGERVLFAARHAWKGLEPYHFPVLISDTDEDC